MTKRKSINLTEFDILSAIWVLSCNDENPIISYQGIIFRLQLSGEQRIDEQKIRDLVSSRPELFRKGVPKFRLKRWKKVMLDRKKIPSWIKSYPTDEQEGVISKLSTDDVFRNQFRTKSFAQPTDLEKIEWGLSHINRLRQANQDAKIADTRSWQIWLVFAIGLINIVLSIIFNLQSPAQTNEIKDKGNEIINECSNN